MCTLITFNYFYSPVSLICRWSFIFFILRMEIPSLCQLGDWFFWTSLFMHRASYWQRLSKKTGEDICWNLILSRPVWGRKSSTTSEVTFRIYHFRIQRRGWLEVPTTYYLPFLRNWSRKSVPLHTNFLFTYLHSSETL